jgi:outer membrane protein OmpA-like peptidoglycan-associated protein
MRMGLGRYVAASIVAIAMPVSAQTAAEPSVASYLCTFAGKCGDAEEAAVTREAPATKGFRIARTRPQASAMADPAPARVVRPAMAAAPVPAAARPRPRPYTPAARPVPAAGTQRPRADLMITFDLGSDRMTAAGVAKARVFAQSLLLPELRAMRFLIEGHTDSLGNADSNRDLSRRRANAVADFLAAQGVGRDRLEVKGFGADAPLGGHRASDPLNRRVEAALIS